MTNDNNESIESVEDDVDVVNDNNRKDDGDDDEENTQSVSKQCFTVVSSRRFGSLVSPSTCRLCPSMDLMVFGLVNPNVHNTTGSYNETNRVDGGGEGTLQQQYRQASTQALWLHRTLNASGSASVASQKLAALHCDARTACWRPDGRLLAVVVATNDAGTQTGTDKDGIDAESDDGNVVFTDSLDMAEKKPSISEKYGLLELSLFHVEEMMLSAGGGRGRSDTRAGGGLDGTNIRGKLVALLLHGQDTAGVTWALVGRPHPAWNESNDTIPWTYQQRFVDRKEPYSSSYDYSSYDEMHEYTAVSMNSVLPDCKTPLTLLGVATTTDAIEGVQILLNLYLHGRFAILQDWPLKLTNLDVQGSTLGRRTSTESDTPGSVHKQPSVDMLMSSNLTHLMILPKTSTSIVRHSGIEGNSIVSTTLLHVIKLPLEVRYRYHWQIITTLTCRIQSLLQVMQRQTQDVAASYKSSLKPLDMKFDILERLMQKYKDPPPGDPAPGALSSLQAPATNPDDPLSNINSLFMHFVVFGLVSNDSLTSVLEQFFTNVQMNDQLLIRMERSLSTAVANVESQLRRLLPSARHIVVQASELYALAQTVDFDGGMNATGLSDNDTHPSLLSIGRARYLYDCSCQLVLALENALTVLIDTRFRLRDGVAWLRHAGASVRAHNAGPSSPQVEAAKKKRVPQAVVQRVISFWQQAGNLSTTHTASSTERFLGVRFGDLLQEDDTTSRVSLLPNNRSKQTLKIPNVTSGLSQALNAFAEVPKKFMERSVQCRRLELVHSCKQALFGSDSHVLCAMTTRLGQGGADPNLFYMQDRINGFFSPKVSNRNQSNTGTTDFREWLVLAESSLDENENGTRNVIYLHALPLAWASNIQDEDELDSLDLIYFEEEGSLTNCFASDFYWTTMLELPEGLSVMDIAFYGDDGRSSLSAGTDSGTGKERRQALGLVVDRGSLALELWLVSYDSCVFTQRPIHPRQNAAEKWSSIDSSSFDYYNTESHVRLRPMTSDSDDEYEEVRDHTLFAKTRNISCGNVKGKQCNLVLSGSRGIGAVLSSQHGLTSVDLLDLEEDEEEDDEENMSTES